MDSDFARIFFAAGSGLAEAANDTNNIKIKLMLFMLFYL